MYTPTEEHLGDLNPSDLMNALNLPETQLNPHPGEGRGGGAAGHDPPKALARVPKNTAHQQIVQQNYSPD